MARITYTTRSKFQKNCDNFVGQNRTALTSGQRVKWNTGWPGKGFPGDTYVLIAAGKHFDATFPYQDLSTFSLRIRVIATALRDAGLFHPFHITHKDGVVTVQRIDHAAAGQAVPAGHTTIIIPRVQKKKEFWDELRGLLEEARKTGIKIGRIVFRGGGDVEIPDWFKDWCKDNDIEIAILDPEAFDAEYSDETEVTLTRE